MKQHYDIIIIGAGPAGSTLARQLKDHYRVLLVDKRPLDKEPSKLIKNCGGLIAPDAQKALASFGLSIPKEVLVSPQMFSVETIDIDNDIVQSYQRHYINVDRERYDRWLVSLCDDRIDTAFSTRFKGAKKHNDKYTVTLLENGEKREVTTDIIIGADGANSRVRNTLLPSQKKLPKRYISIQEWFPNADSLNQYVAIFDQEVSDFYSWIIPKDSGVIFGTAIEEGKDATMYHNLQKEKLKKYGYHLNTPTKKEGCYLLRPHSSKEVQLGNNNIALIGEAAGFISPTSAEGISYAMISADMLANALIENKENFLRIYERNTKALKKNIDRKMYKYPIMYHKVVRKMILNSGIGALKVQKNNPLTALFPSVCPPLK